MLIKAIRELKRAGVLGINRRNAHYTLVYNPRSLYPLVDEKLNTKRIALERGLSVPELYGVVETEHQIRKIPEMLAPYKDFAVKPSRGSGGKGIMVITGRSKELYRVTDGRLIDQHELNYHIANILSGMFSLGGRRDRAMIEYRVRFDPVFEFISYMGVPDIRIIVFLGVPAMAMVRLPTRMSKGMANLHQGAVGAGIDLATGVTNNAVWRNKIIDEHPDTGESVIGVPIPNWRRLVELAAGCYELTGLGYIGVDIVLDKTKGPLILELNARPGLSIQIANNTGLIDRLKVIETHHKELSSVNERVDFAVDRFKRS
jgi:alpha-L-glutamate ligase-like protein